MKIESLALVMHRVEDHVAALVHGIVKTERGFVLDAGRVMGTQERDSLVSMLEGRRDDRRRRYLPPNVLVAQTDFLCWYRPAGMASLGFSSGQVEAMVPPLVFFVDNGDLRVAALKSDNRPDRQDMVFHSGFPNVGSDGRWCSGNNRVPEFPTIDDIPRTERMFFESRFTHGGGSFLSGVKDVMEFWQSSRRRRAFPKTKLVAMKRLSEWAGV